MMKKEKQVQLVLIMVLTGLQGSLCLTEWQGTPFLLSPLLNVIFFLSVPALLLMAGFKMLAKRKFRKKLVRAN